MEERKRTPADVYSPLSLAFVGDGVYDLLVRDYLIRQANRPVGELNKMKVSLVKCESQARFASSADRSLSRPARTCSSTSNPSHDNCRAALRSPSENAARGCEVRAARSNRRVLSSLRLPRVRQ